MEINIDMFDTLAARGAIQKGEWGDGHERACLMSAVVTGAQSVEECAMRGWPLWLAELCVWLFDGYDDDYIIRGRTLITAISDADARGADWDRVYKTVRLQAILPIAMESVGGGDEPWRVACREAVQWSLDHGGAANPQAAGAARAARAAEAAWAAEAAGAARAARAAWAARAAEAARLRIENALMSACKE